MRVLVTGCRGFIGSHFISKFGYKVGGVDKKDGIDITSNKFLFDAYKWKPSLIVHLAANCSTAKSLENPVDDFQNNVVGTLQVCELARITGAKVLYTSTCKVQPNDEGIRTPYGLSKYVGELYLQEYSKLYGFEYIINRPGTIYGPGQKGSPESDRKSVV